MGQIRELQKRIYASAVDHGFHDVGRTSGDGLMLIVTEAAEAMEDVRLGHMETKRRAGDGKPEGMPSEIADIVIRCLDFAEEHNFDLEEEVFLKVGYNETREFMHGGKAL